MPRNSTTDSERNPKVVTLVVFGIAYALLTLLWFWLAPANGLTDPSKLDLSVRKFTEFFAIIAAPLWFFTALNQATTFRVRVVVLSIGLLVLFPLPLFVGVSPL